MEQVDRFGNCVRYGHRLQNHVFPHDQVQGKSEARVAFSRFQMQKLELYWWK